MKQINAIIRAAKLSAVSKELESIPEITGMTTYPVRGFGSHAIEPLKSAHTYSPLLKEPPGSNASKLEPHVKVEIICMDNVAEMVIVAISQAARTGKEGDGKITVTNVEDIVRIQTGERGEKAIESK